MKLTSQIATVVALGFLCALMTGCGTVFALLVERNWDLGVCRESESGSCGCAVKVPKCLAGVGLFAKVEPESIAAGHPFETGNLRFRMQNQESHMVVIQGLETEFVILQPGESTILKARSGGDKLGYICSLDTSEAPLRFTIEVLGRPEGATIRILGHSSDAL
jgi:hypothetical protein